MIAFARFIFAAFAAPWLLAAPLLAQTPARPAHISFLSSEDEIAARPIIDALRVGLSELGLVEGRNYEIDARYARRRPDLYPALVSEVLTRGTDVIIASNTPAAAAAKKATRSVPIAAFSCGMESMVESLARPGGNMTGVTCQSPDLVAKQLQLLWELLPGLKRIAVLVNPSTPYVEPVVLALRGVGGANGTNVTEISVRSPGDFDSAIAQIRQSGAGAVLLAPDSMLFSNRAQLMPLLQALRLPAIGFFREFVEDGALLSYSANRVERFKRLAWYVDRILKGEKPAVLPVDQPTQFEMVINRTTAKALGILIPQSVLRRADDVIQ